MLLHPTSERLNTYIPGVLGYWERTWGLFLGGGVGLGTWPLSHKNLLGRSGLGVSGGFRGEMVVIGVGSGTSGILWRHGLPDVESDQTPRSPQAIRFEKNGHKRNPRRLTHQ